MKRMMSNIGIGVDIGGTTIKFGVFTKEGELLAKEEIPTRKEQNGELIPTDIQNQIEKMLLEGQYTREQLIGVGIGVPGAVTDDGIVNKCVNLGWGVLPIEKIMAEKLGTTVKVGNDANVAALGEYWKGAAKGYHSMMLITIGTGVGAGIIINGKPINGAHGAAAEIGHIPIIEDETQLCNCGKKGCLEQVSSATGIVRVAYKMMEQYNIETILSDKKDGISAKDIFDGAQKGDKLCSMVAEYVCRSLAKGMACAAGIIDPECFLIGGGVSAAGEYLIQLLKKNYTDCYW